MAPWVRRVVGFFSKEEDEEAKQAFPTTTLS
jgi:hypothetical protein